MESFIRLRSYFPQLLSGFLGPLRPHLLDHLGDRAKPLPLSFHPLTFLPLYLVSLYILSSIDHR